MFKVHLGRIINFFTLLLLYVLKHNWIEIKQQLIDRNKNISWCLNSFFINVDTNNIY